MKTIKIFLASSNELKRDREQFEIEINRKNKAWAQKGIFLHLEIWEDLSSRKSSTRSQDEYNKKIKESDIFILLACNKVGMYTAEEFDTAFGAFKATSKPFIFTWFKNPTTTPEASLQEFKEKLAALGHFHATYSNSDDLWNQFNKELERLEGAGFEKNEFIYTIIVNNQGADIKNQFYGGTFNDPKFIYGGKTINKYLGTIPLTPDIFLGRENDLDALHEKLFQGNNMLLLVNGEGGVGKTTLAAQYYHTHSTKYTHLTWVFAEKSLRDAILTLAWPLQITFPERMTENDRLQNLLSVMIELKKPCLLVIDNANSIEDLEAHYHLLKACHNFHILLTTRITDFEHAETHAVKPLDNKRATELFVQHYPAHSPEEDNLLQEILQAVGYNTLVIELLAKNLGNFNNRLRKRYALGDLLADLQKRGLFGLSQSGTISIAYHGDGLGLRKEKPETILAAMYNLTELDSFETEMLSVLSVLPAEPIDFRTLEDLLPDTYNLDTTLLRLSRKGWIEYNNTTNSFKCSPVVQEVTRLQNKEMLLEDCELLINTIIGNLVYDSGSGNLVNVSYDTGILYVRYAERITNVTLISHPTSQTLLPLFDCIGNFHKTTGNLDKALTFFEGYSRLHTELYDADPQNISFKEGLACSYERLGNTHTALGNLDTALTFFKDETRLFKELYDADPQNVNAKFGLACSYGNLGNTHTNFGNLDTALTFFNDATRLFRELYDADLQNVSFKNGLANSYEQLGTTHSHFGNLDTALTFFKNETRLRTELHDADPFHEQV